MRMQTKKERIKKGEKASGQGKGTGGEIKWKELEGRGRNRPLCNRRRGKSNTLESSRRRKLLYLEKKEEGGRRGKEKERTGKT